jgi:hypothetical protein
MRRPMRALLLLPRSHVVPPSGPYFGRLLLIFPGVDIVIDIECSAVDNVDDEFVRVERVLPELRT